MAETKFVLNPAWSGRQIPAGFHPQLVPFMERLGDRIVPLAVRLCPKDEGDLSGTIRHHVDTGREVRLVVSAGNMRGPNKFVNYAAHVELGTSKAPAQPFLRPAVRQTVGLSRVT